MSDNFTIKGHELTPESPVRLRECLTALASHTGVHVLRFEVGLGASTRVEGEPSFSMTLTHSMGPEHEKEIVSHLARAFVVALDHIIDKAKDSPNESDPEAR
jgi:hypothetical protein